MTGAETFRNGCLYTGDLGEADSKNHIYIKGRKKDMLITSYGKNINCSKIEQMNATLSHPEQVKRWCIISQALSISNGELTPNLKVRRNIVIEHFRKEVDKLYE